MKFEQNIFACLQFSLYIYFYLYELGYIGLSFVGIFFYLIEKKLNIQLFDNNICILYKKWFPMFISLDPPSSLQSSKKINNPQFNNKSSRK